ncbi:MAG: YitT family protein [Lachnospiraceae bacterium]|nr:YitT family protein [Lachnospiraceae bacterium]
MVDLFHKKSDYMDYLLIFVGAGLMALAINLAFEPAGMVTGGFTGIAIIIKNVTAQIVPGGIPLWMTNIILNIPLIILGIRMKGARFLAKTIFGAVVLSVWLAVMPVYDIARDDFLLAAIIGGVIQGAGIGLVFAGKGTTGGSDTVAALVQNHLRHYSIAQVMQVVDAVIVLAGAFVFGFTKALYAIIAIYIVAKVSDGLIEGLKFSKAAYIITEEPERMANAIMEHVDRGVTGIHARGMYSKQEKTMLFCVVAKKQIVHLKDVVREIDPRAFVIVSDAREVLGEGFMEIHE